MRKEESRESAGLAVIESMNGARFVHDSLELLGWQVEIADADKVKGLAPLACKTDRIDAWVLAELSRRDLVPTIWLPDPGVRSGRELACWRLHLVRHRTGLKNRVHAGLITFGRPCPFSDLFGVGGRAMLDRLELPEPWHGDIEAALRLIDGIDAEIGELDYKLVSEAKQHRDVPLLMSAAASAMCLATQLLPKSATSRSSPVRRSSVATPVFAPGCTSPVSATIEAASPKPVRSSCGGRSSKPLPTPPGTLPTPLDTSEQPPGSVGAAAKKVARVDLARHLTEAVWHMLTKRQPFAPTVVGSPPAA